MAKSEAVDHDEIREEFDKLVNMTPAKLQKWPATEHSPSVGWVHEGESESVGHESWRKIVEITHKKKADLTDDDYRHMHKVVGYIHRHLAQRGPADYKEHSRWRYSLMNWGHEPLEQ